MEESVSCFFFRNVYFLVNGWNFLLILHVSELDMQDVDVCKFLPLFRSVSATDELRLFLGTPLFFFTGEPLAYFLILFLAEPLCPCAIVSHWFQEHTSMKENKINSIKPIDAPQAKILEK